MNEVFEEIGDHWRDDAFNRKEYAKFLSSYLSGKVLGAGTSLVPKSFTMALDANWGSGKTFFMHRWAEDLRATSSDQLGHTVVSFDAWAADYATDPLVAFMSELRAELQKALKAGGLAPKAKAQASHAINKATQNIRRLALPAIGLVLKAATRKVSGVDVDEIVGLVRDEVSTSTDSAPSSSDEHLKVKDVLPEKQVDATLDRLFSIQLSEHTKRRDSIKDFKAELEIVLKVLNSRKGFSAPLFIFVDELDRCKASFAVGLLEAIKHIFGVPGVCVVIATNMDQLAHTVKAVYGQGFDARTYLQRFFDAIYALPSASGPLLLQTWLKERPIFNDQRCKWGIPRRGFGADAFGEGKPGLLAWIFDALKLDLRSQGQVIELMEATALGVPTPRSIHVAWLALVCGLWHTHRSQFDEIEAAARIGNNGEEVWNKLELAEVKRKIFLGQVFPGDVQERQVSVKDVATTYCSKANGNLIEIRSRYDGDARTFSGVVLGELVEDAPNQYNSGTHYPTGLLDYFQLVRTAGHLTLG